ncbi:probable cardiolipin synthase (CMP-forming) [Centruroides vittatus]|uniref:probable cardiolipin synthase (CMP-forming) n=1 Tax=Centruroides vittatus TaxID=120091 RepID=UPI0035109329
MAFLFGRYLSVTVKYGDLLRECTFGNFKYCTCINFTNSSSFYPKNVSWLGFRFLSVSARNRLRWSRCAAHQTSSKRDSREGHIAVLIKPRENGRLKRTRIKLKETTHNVTKRITEIKENVLTVPNGLSVLRITLTPVLGYLVINGNYFSALGIFIFAGITDLLDGFIARTFPSQQSMIGSFLDPMADKFLIATLFLSLTIVGLIPIPLTALIVVRDMCLVAAGFYIRYHSLPPPRTLGRYFDVTFATAKLSPTFISKVNTTLQLTLAAITLAAPVFQYVDHPYVQALWYGVASTTVISGMSYIFGKDTYKFLHYRTKKQ